MVIIQESETNLVLPEQSTKFPKDVPDDIVGPIAHDI